MNAAAISSAWFAFRRFDLHYWLRSRIVPSRRYHMVNTGLPYGYHEPDARMLYACMALLCVYVDKNHDGVDGLEAFARELNEDPDEWSREGCARQAEAEAEACTIYRWWTEQRPADHARHDDEMMRLFGPGNSGSREERDQHHAFEAELDERDQAMLHRLIDIRRSLWT